MQALFFELAHNHVVETDVDQIGIQLNGHQVFDSPDVGEGFEFGKVDFGIKIDGGFSGDGESETREQSQHCEKESNRVTVATKGRVFFRHVTPWGRQGTNVLRQFWVV